VPAVAAAPELAKAAEVDPVLDVIKRHRRAVRAAQRAKALMDSCDDPHRPYLDGGIVVGKRPERVEVVVRDDEKREACSIRADRKNAPGHCALQI
jgi:hypothetical protein